MIQRPKRSECTYDRLDFIADCAQVKSAYESQLKALQGKLQAMEAEAKRREREISEHQQRMDKIDTLQRSLEEAKNQVCGWLCGIMCSSARSDAS